MYSLQIFLNMFKIHCFHNHPCQKAHLPRRIFRGSKY